MGHDWQLHLVISISHKQGAEILRIWFLVEETPGDKTALLLSFQVRALSVDRRTHICLDPIVDIRISQASVSKACRVFVGCFDEAQATSILWPPADLGKT